MDTMKAGIHPNFKKQQLNALAEMNLKQAQ